MNIHFTPKRKKKNRAKWIQEFSLPSSSQALHSHYWDCQDCTAALLCPSAEHRQAQLLSSTLIQATAVLIKALQGQAKDTIHTNLGLTASQALRSSLPLNSHFEIRYLLSFKPHPQQYAFTSSHSHPSHLSGKPCKSVTVLSSCRMATRRAGATGESQLWIKWDSDQRCGKLSYLLYR